MNIKKTNAFSRTFQLSIPLIFTRLINVGCNFIGMLMIATLGHEALAAGALISATLSFLQVAFWSILFSMSVVISRMYGAKHYHAIGDVFNQGIFLSLLLCLPVILLMWNIGLILTFLHEPKVTVDLCVPYFRMACFSVLPDFWMICATQLVVAVGRPQLTTIWSCMTVPFKLILGYALLYGKWGLPNLGISGIAAANAIVACIFTLGICLYLKLNNYYQLFNIFKSKFIIKKAELLLLIKIGLPIAIQVGGELGGFVAGTLMIGWLGEVSLAAHQIVLQNETLFLMIPFGIMQASSILVSQSIGEKNYHFTKKYSYTGLTLSSILAVLIGIVYITNPDIIIRWYLDAHAQNFAAISKLAHWIFFTAAFLILLDSTRNMLIGVLRGYHDTKIPMLIGLGTFWLIGLPVGYFFSFYTRAEAAGFRLGWIIAFCISIILLWTRLQFQLRKLPHE